MFQQSPHFLFTEIYFGPIEDLDSEVDEEGLEIEVDLDPCTLVMDPHPHKIQSHSVGIFFPWSEKIGGNFSP